MAYDEGLADRIRVALPDDADVDEIRMFGGLCFMVGGHMACGVMGDELIVRLGADAAGRALGEAHVRPMDFTGRPMRGIVVVGPEGIAGADALAGWIDRATAFVGTLGPPRPRRARRRPPAPPG